MAARTKYVKLNTAHPRYAAAISQAETEFLVAFPDNLFSNNVAADARNQSWAKILESTDLSNGVILNTATRGQQHTDRVLADVRFAGWEPML